MSNPASICARLKASYAAGVKDHPEVYRLPLDRFECSLLPLFDRYWPAICDPQQGKDTFLAAFQFHVELRELVGLYPLAWFRVFHDAFRAKVFGAIAWGPMIRSIYTTINPSGDMEHFGLFLKEMRDFSGHALMMPGEWRPFDELPDFITVYRGSLVENPDDAFRGISWSLRRQYANFHITRRLAQSDFRAAADTGRAPLLVSVTIPRDFAFAYLSNPGDDEVLVDFERIDPAQVCSPSAPMAQI